MSEEDDAIDWRMFLPSYVHAISKDIACRSSDVLGHYGLKACHLPYLVILIQKGSATMRELTEQTGTDKANTTRVILELREKGIVTDDRKEPNSRKYKVFLTAKGKEIVKKSRKEFESSINDLFSSLTEEELEVLIKIMKKTKESLNK